MPKRLAILYDCPFPFIQGGGQRRLFEIAQYHLAHDWEVEWYALKFWEGPDKIKHEGIIYNSVGKWTELYDSAGKRRLWETIYYGAMIARHVELRKFDILLAGQWPLFHLIPARIFCFLGKSKLVVDWWEIWGREHWKNYYGIKGVLGSLLEKLLSKITPYIIAITERGKRQLQELGVKKNEVVFIPNGIDFEKIMGAIAKSKKFDLVYMGRLQNHKNISHILQGVALLKDRGCSITFQIIGDGPEKQRLGKLVYDLSLDQEVKFTGWLEKDAVIQHLQYANVFIMPSKPETLGRVYLESTAAGCLCVCHKGSGVDGFFRDRESAIFCDATTIKNDILEVLKGINSSEIQKYISSAKELLKQLHWNEISNKYLDLFGSTRK